MEHCRECNRPGTLILPCACRPGVHRECLDTQRGVDRVWTPDIDKPFHTCLSCGFQYHFDKGPVHFCNRQWLGDLMVEMVVFAMLMTITYAIDIGMLRSDRDDIKSFCQVAFLVCGSMVLVVPGLLHWFTGRVFPPRHLNRGFLDIFDLITYMVVYLCFAGNYRSDTLLVAFTTFGMFACIRAATVCLRPIWRKQSDIVNDVVHDYSDCVPARKTPSNGPGMSDPIPELPKATA